MKPRKIVVTGGAGFLGSHVTRLLLEKNNSVTILDDFSNGKTFNLKEVSDNPLLTIINGDVTNPDDVSAAFESCEIVFHLAVLGLRQSIKEPKRVSEVIVDGTINCLQTALENKIELFVNCSSSEVYGTATYVPIDELHPLNPETPYAAAKVAQDMYVHSYGCTYKLPWVTMRPFNMYGPNSHWQGYRGELIPRMIVSAMNGQPLAIFGDGSQTRDFTYVEDAAKAMIAIAEKSNCRNKCVNFCQGSETSVRQIAELICNYFGIDPEEFIQNHASRPGDVLRHLGGNSKFMEWVGYRPQVGMEEGLGRTIKWFQSLPYSKEELLTQVVLKNWE